MDNPTKQAALDGSGSIAQNDGAPSTLITQAVKGMGGIGKTQLAVEFAYRYGPFFYGVHWLDGNQPDGLDELVACGAALGLPDWPQERPEQVARTLKTWREGGPRLIILDNLENVAAAREWLARLGGGPLRVLLTARRADWPADLGLRLLSLDVFTRAESVEFLRRSLPEERASASDLETLAGRLGDLPLALELAARYLTRVPRLTIAEYLTRLDRIWDDPSMRRWREELGSPTGHDLDLPATFALSWERVTDPAARRVLTLAGHCAPNQPIPCELLEQAAGLERTACDEAVSLLDGLGLLRTEDKAGPTLHPLLAEYALSQPGAAELLPALVAALAQQAQAATAQMDQTGRPACFEPLLPHARRVAEEVVEAEMADAGRLWNELGYYLDRAADYVGARAAFERALAILVRFLPPEHPTIEIVREHLRRVGGG